MPNCGNLLTTKFESHEDTFLHRATKFLSPSEDLLLRDQPKSQGMLLTMTSKLILIKLISQDLNEA